MRFVAILPLFWALLRADLETDTAITCGLRQYILSPLNISIYGCIFAGLRQNGDGGAIYLSSDELRASVNFSSFENCASQYYGGAIYCNALYFSLHSVCGCLCSAAFGAMFAFNFEKDNTYVLDSVSLFNCNNIDNIGDGTIVSEYVYLRLRFVNISTAASYGAGAAVGTNNIDNCSSIFMTVSNLSDFSCLFNIYSGFELKDSNIVGNNGSGLCCVQFINSNLRISSCVFASNSFVILIKSQGTNFGAVFENCWFEWRSTPPSADKVTFYSCNMNSTMTLSFIDCSLFVDGVSCGIRLPSPSISGSPVPSISSVGTIPSSVIHPFLTSAQISWIVVGSISIFAVFGCLIWFFTRKATGRKFLSDVQTVNLLRNLETSYG